ncbi:hypothetical protein TNCV_1922841 [Trichonephila clavipes]|nr:hypothetical protein TNCV_1922841 [Trichonephila clavipes]
MFGRLGNASRREPTLECPHPWKRALETHVERKPVPIELSIATIPSDGSDPQVITVNHSGLTSTPHEHERLCLVHVPLPKPVEYLSFCMRGKLSQMSRGGLMVFKGTEQQKILLELGVVAMSLETLPEFNAIYDGTFPISLHEEANGIVIIKPGPWKYRSIVPFPQYRGPPQHCAVSPIPGPTQYCAFSTIPGPTLCRFHNERHTLMVYWHLERLRKWKHAMCNLMESKVPLADGCANSFGENNQKEGFKRNKRKEKDNK